LFITFEGIEGTGKTTQIKLLASWLEKKGSSVVLTREPGGTAIGDDIRRILLDSRHQNMAPLAELLLYAASRAQHLEEVIKPALKAKKMVLCDRFSDATTAYQGYGRNLPLELIQKIHQITSDTLIPHKTFLFDLPVEVGLKRAWHRIEKIKNGNKEDRFEKEALWFHQRIRDGYLRLAQNEPERFVIIDANRDAEIVFNEIKKHVEKWIG